MIERVDFVFSYWILIWYILYELHLVTFNPKFALFVGILENVMGLAWMIYYSYKHIALFLIINFVLKIIPFYRLRKTKYTRRDIYATFAIFALHCVWLFMHRIYFHDIAWTQLHLIQQNKPIGPIMTLVMNLNTTRSVRI